MFDELKTSLKLYDSVRVWVGVPPADAADAPAAEMGTGDGTGDGDCYGDVRGNSGGSPSSSKRARTDTPPLDPAGTSCVSLGGAQAEKPSQPPPSPPSPPPPPSGRVLTADVTAPMCSPCWRLLPSANALQVLISPLHTR